MKRTYQPSKPQGPTRRIIKRTKNPAITVGVLGLIGTVAAALIGILPHFWPKPPPPSIVYNISGVFIQTGTLTDEQLKQITSGLSPASAESRANADTALKELKAAFRNQMEQVPPQERAAIEDAAYRVASEFTQFGFALSPTNTVLDVSDHYVAKVMVPVTKGLEYVFITVASQSIGKLNLHLYDEDGELLSDFKDSGDRSVHPFRAAYTGTVELFVEATDVRGPSTVACLVGRRGVESEEAESRSLGSEPTFEMPTFKMEKETPHPGISASPFNEHR